MTGSNVSFRSGSARAARSCTSVRSTAAHPEKSGVWRGSVSDRNRSDSWWMYSDVQQLQVRIWKDFCIAVHEVGYQYLIESYSTRVSTSNAIS